MSDRRAASTSSCASTVRIASSRSADAAATTGESPADCGAIDPRSAGAGSCGGSRPRITAAPRESTTCAIRFRLFKISVMELISVSRDCGTATTGDSPKVAVTSSVEFSRPRRRNSSASER